MDREKKPAPIPSRAEMEWIAEDINSMVYFYRFATRVSAGSNNTMLDTIKVTVREYQEMSPDNPHSFALPAWDYIEFMVAEAQRAFDKARKEEKAYVTTLTEHEEHENALSSIMRAIDVDVLQRENPKLARDEAEAFIALNPRFYLTVLANI
jgi:hypothetical protein